MCLPLICWNLGMAAEEPRTPMGWVAPLTDAEAWDLLPKADTGQGSPLPSWARMLVRQMPRTTAALLELDYAQRTAGPIPAVERSAMRYIAARELGCEYGIASSLADLRRASVSEQLLVALDDPQYPGWSDGQRQALVFAKDMTVNSDTISDQQFASLVAAYDERTAASMVLLMAYANFHNRLVFGLGAPIEQGGPLPPVNVDFPQESLVLKTTPPPVVAADALPKPTGEDLIVDGADWVAFTYDDWQQKLEAQRNMPTRLRIPEWRELEGNLPPGMMTKPSDIIWYRIAFGYAHELAIPFEFFMRTAGSEISRNWDRIFGNSLFWMVTRGMKCPYCMGHCEMNWEVAGLSAEEIAERSRVLNSDDWSSFSPAEQHALAFAMQMTNVPLDITAEQLQQLRDGFGEERALYILFNTSRYHYMTRISNGFQLTLERENVFYDYYNQTPPAKRP
jgi:alkylhydroperoxidase family enzyme